MKHQRDDSPLYIFDSTFDDDREAKCLLRDYKVRRSGHRHRVTYASVSSTTATRSMAPPLHFM